MVERIGKMFAVVLGLALSGASIAETEFSYSLSLGSTIGKVKTLLDGGDNPAADTSDWEAGPHAAFGVHGLYADRHELGIVASYSTADSDGLLSIRPFDYRYLITDNLRLKAFFGVARYDKETAAHGYYLGIGGEWRVLSQSKADGLGLGLEFAYGDKIARDRVLPSDPPSTMPSSPEIFYDMTLVNTYIAWYF